MINFEDGIKRGSGDVKIIDNILYMGGREPRWYSKVEHTNIECSVTFKKDSDTGKNWSGCVLGIRSHPEGHSNDAKKMGYPAHTYYLRVRGDGNCDIYGEPVHHDGSGHTIYTVKNTHTLITGKEYRIKYKAYNTDRGIQFKIWIDDDLKLDYLHTEGFMYKGSGVCFLRTSACDKSVYKGLYLKEINQTEPIKKDKRITGYYSEWAIYQRDYHIRQIDGNKLTHLCYAFMHMNLSRTDYKLMKGKSKYPPKPYYPDIPEGTIAFHDEYAGLQNMKELEELKKKYPHLKVLISVGGWTLSLNFSTVMADRQKRTQFVRSSVDFVLKHGFDGIDLDFEYPHPKEGIGYNHSNKDDIKNFILTLKEMREYMDLKKKGLEITTSCGCDPVVLSQYGPTEPYIDALQLMTYDFSGGTWQTHVGHHSALYHDPKDEDNNVSFNTDEAVKLALDIGYKSDKISIGIPFYGRGFDQVKQYKEGEIYGQSGGTTSTLSGDYGEAGMSSYRDIRKAIDSGEYKEYYDDVSKTSWCKKDDKIISFDSVRSVREKMKYINDNNLAGCLIWCLSDDSRDGEKSLLDAINGEYDIPVEVPRKDEVIEDKNCISIIIINNGRRVTIENITELSFKVV